MPLTLRLALLLALASACAAMPLYGSPRPLAPGQVQTTVLLETSANGAGVFKPGTERVLPVQAPFTAPGLEMRFGLSSGLDLGARLGGVEGFALDTKIALLDRRPLSLSLDPAVVATGYAFAGGAVGGQASLRLLGGWRFDSTFELIGHTTGGVLHVEDDKAVLKNVGTWGGGLSLLIHATPSFALQPSLTSLWRGDRARWAPDLSFGLGFVFGEGS